MIFLILIYSPLDRLIPYNYEKIDEAVFFDTSFFKHGYDMDSYFTYGHLIKVEDLPKDISVDLEARVNFGNIIHDVPVNDIPNNDLTINTTNSKRNHNDDIPTRPQTNKTKKNAEIIPISVGAGGRDNKKKSSKSISNKDILSIFNSGLVNKNSSSKEILQISNKASTDKKIELSKSSAFLTKVNNNTSKSSSKFFSPQNQNFMEKSFLNRIMLETTKNKFRKEKKDESKDESRDDSNRDVLKAQRDKVIRINSFGDDYKEEEISYINSSLLSSVKDDSFVTISSINSSFGTELLKKVDEKSKEKYQKKKITKSKITIVESNDSPHNELKNDKEIFDDLENLAKSSIFLKQDNYKGREISNPLEKKKINYDKMKEQGFNSTNSDEENHRGYSSDTNSLTHFPVNENKRPNKQKRNFIDREIPKVKFDETAKSDTITFYKKDDNSTFSSKFYETNDNPKTNVVNSESSDIEGQKIGEYGVEHIVEPIKQENEQEEIKKEIGEEEEEYKHTFKPTLTDYEELPIRFQLKYDRRGFLSYLRDQIFDEHIIFALFFKKSLLYPAYIRIIKNFTIILLNITINTMLYTDDDISTKNNLDKQPDVSFIKLNLFIYYNFSELLEKTYYGHYQRLY